MLASTWRLGSSAAEVIEIMQATIANANALYRIVRTLIVVELEESRQSFAKSGGMKSHNLQRHQNQRFDFRQHKSTRPRDFAGRFSGMHDEYADRSLRRENTDSYRMY
jgi:hypothetical protein